MLYRWAILPSRHLPDSNRRGRSPVDFESTALTTRPRCRWIAARGHRLHGRTDPRPCASPYWPPVFFRDPNATRPYHAGVSSDRTNLSPFTKDYRGLALQCDLAVFRALRGAHQKKKKYFLWFGFNFFLFSPISVYYFFLCISSFAAPITRKHVNTLQRSNDAVAQSSLHRWQEPSVWSENWCWLIASCKLKPITHSRSGSASSEVILEAGSFPAPTKTKQNLL